jgi:hypothetical protein
MNQIVFGDTTTVTIQHAIQIMNSLHRSVSDAARCGSRDEPWASVWGGRWIESLFNDVCASKPMLFPLQANAISLDFCESPMIVSQAAVEGRDSSCFVKKERRGVTQSDHPSRDAMAGEGTHPPNISACSIAASVLDNSWKSLVIVPSGETELGWQGAET